MEEKASGKCPKAVLEWGVDKRYQACYFGASLFDTRRNMRRKKASWLRLEVRNLNFYRYQADK